VVWETVVFFLNDTCQLATGIMLQTLPHCKRESRRNNTGGARIKQYFEIVLNGN